MINHIKQNATIKETKRRSQVLLCLFLLDRSPIRRGNPPPKLQLVQFPKGKEKDRQMDRLIDAMCQVNKSLFLPSTVFPRSLVLLRHRKIFLFKEEGVANGFKMSEIQSDSVIKLVNTLLC